MSGRSQPMLPLGPDLDRPWPFGDLPSGHFRTILADPPWAFSNWSAKGEKKNANQHYTCMPLTEIQALPVSELAHPEGCGLIMWATSPLLDQQIDTLKAWGFEFKGAGAWGKRTSTNAHWAFGPGYILRATAEFYLIGTRGKPKRLSASVRNFIEAPVREHSRKPERMRRDAEALWAGPRLEMFARQTAPGWSCFGNETDRFAPDGETSPRGADARVTDLVHPV
jgi:N6-adenosine-specific RNA methylase IME4